jgi:DNA-binding NarL/FixJ family response regulator
MSISVFLVDDHAMFREGIRLLLGTQKDMEVVGEAGNGRDAVRQVTKLCPDIILMDIAMPEMNGIEAAQQIGETCPSSRMIILSMYSTNEHIYRVFKAGARGYILKESAGADIIKAIRAVHSGKFYTSESVSEVIMTDYMTVRDMMEAESPLDRLSAREREVLQLLVEGKSNQKMAEILFLSQKTVETYRSHLMQKLGITDIPSLVKFAIQHGLTSVD